MRDGELVPEMSADAAKARLFRNSLPEGTRVEVFMDRVTGDERSLAQLAKVHSVIRVLSEETGQSFESVKKSVKERAGLFAVDETGSTVVKSFADCSKEELSRAIESCLEFGDELGLVLD